MATKFNKWPQNVTNRHKIYQQLPLQDPPKFTQIVNFGLNIYHLATLMQIATATKTESFGFRSRRSLIFTTYPVEKVAQRLQ
jgi:hypothetical protein